MGVGTKCAEDFKLKPMKCEMNYLSKSDGSAILSQGETVALVSVNGPLDIKMQSQSIEKCTLEVLFSSKSGKPSVADRYKENIIRQTCEMVVLGSLYPRTGIAVTIQELEDYGGFLACCINCTCLALLNSGVAMRCVFAAVSCAINQDGNVELDPSHSQLEDALAVMNFVFDSRDKSLVTAFTKGCFSENAYTEALERCRSASDLIFAFYRDINGLSGNMNITKKPGKGFTLEEHLEKLVTALKQAEHLLDAAKTQIAKTSVAASGDAKERIQLFTGHYFCL